ncbi:nitrite reductase small subunit NirD [Endozoicomonas sp. SM1973]|uniref:Nitrite reductase small subunit NirD n=1 Tax=Spartinivicinus marinus TaxID=2994442 RepID=A0A853I6L4_9GAMM|nr:nitrite reductase small subunit NirD [Spartinivicinus marinus]MCX4025771.1 nitrite reductase small subunit NirD [Spartinivicinus marinus]NYZ65764.1 nitrite reductase small subunit NirD [Spartinivicinus marinus]
MNLEQTTHLIELKVASILLEDDQQAWEKVCDLSDIPPDSGICIFYQNQQIALFNISVVNKVYAVSNYDPIGKANVMSRGIIGSVGESLVVASPLFKHHFNLITGECIEEPGVYLKTYDVRTTKNKVEIRENNK